MLVINLLYRCGYGIIFFNMTTINQLNRDPLGEVFSHLSTSDLKSCSWVSRLFRRVALDDGLLRKRFALYSWPSNMPPQQMLMQMIHTQEGLLSRLKCIPLERGVRNVIEVRAPGLVSIDIHFFYSLRRVSLDVESRKVVYVDSHVLPPAGVDKSRHSYGAPDAGMVCGLRAGRYSLGLTNIEAKTRVALKDAIFSVLDARINQIKWNYVYILGVVYLTAAVAVMRYINII